MLCRSSRDGGLDLSILVVDYSNSTMSVTVNLFINALSE